MVAAGGSLQTIGGLEVGVYVPANYDPSNGVLVALHGTGGIPETEWSDWHEQLEARGMALIGPWWYDDSKDDYRFVAEVYPAIDGALTQLMNECGGARPDVLFTGFSRGSAESHAYAAEDIAKSKWFDGVLSISGGGSYANPREAILKGSNKMLAGEHAFLWCGTQDFEGDLARCKTMELAQDFLSRHGAVVDHLVQTEEAGHHDFFNHPDVVEQMWAWWETRRVAD